MDINFREFWTTTPNLTEISCFYSKNPESIFPKIFFTSSFERTFPTLTTFEKTNFAFILLYCYIL